MFPDEGAVHAQRPRLDGQLVLRVDGKVPVVVGRAAHSLRNHVSEQAIRAQLQVRAAEGMLPSEAPVRCGSLDGVFARRRGRSTPYVRRAIQRRSDVVRAVEEGIPSDSHDILGEIAVDERGRRRRRRRGGFRPRESPRRGRLPEVFETRVVVQHGAVSHGLASERRRLRVAKLGVVQSDLAVLLRVSELSEGPEPRRDAPSDE